MDRSATHRFIQPACPHLPAVDRPLDHTTTRALGRRRCERFYLAALHYAQSLWREGKPAQAILQLNKSFMADLRGDEAVLRDFPPPYAALVWMLRHRPADRFIGNPVRHFQHLATRVTGERKEIRAWRAWACFHLAQQVLPRDEFPPDAEQVEKEGVAFPPWETVVGRIEADGWPGEAGVLTTVPV